VHSETAVSPERLAGVLGSRRYRVEQMAEGDGVYIFADRFQWAQLGSLLTHAAVIVFILAAVVSRVDAFSSPLFQPKRRSRVSSEECRRCNSS
jgi:cytochrome c biogenesis protein ResB